jgi:ubiquitin carboxyl-terminal hydrolase 34
VNDRLEFPLVLDMEPYTTEGLARKEAEAAGLAPPEPLHAPGYYEYELAGVVVHTGSTDCGHYYSYIKERCAQNGGERKWYEFNDTNVTPFSPDRLDDETFGGIEEYQVVDRETGQRRIERRPKPYNGAPPLPLPPRPPSFFFFLFSFYFA